MPKKADGLVLGHRERYLLAAEVGCHAETIRRWERGEKISRAMEYAIRQAASALEIDLPQHLEV